MVAPRDSDFERHKSPTVLVIDDDRVIRWGLVQMLRESGYRVTEASNGFTGLRFAEQASFDALVLDLGLPDLGGLDLLTLLRSGTGPAAQVPVILITGDDPVSIPEMQRGQVTAVLHKPFPFADLISVIAQATVGPGSSEMPESSQVLHG